MSNCFQHSFFFHGFFLFVVFFFGVSVIAVRALLGRIPPLLLFSSSIVTLLGCNQVVAFHDGWVGESKWNNFFFLPPLTMSKFTMTPFRLVLTRKGPGVRTFSWIGWIERAGWMASGRKRNWGQLFVFWWTIMTAVSDEKPVCILSTNR